MRFKAFSPYLRSLRGRVLLLVCIPFALLLGLLGYQAVSEREIRLQEMRERVQSTARLVDLNNLDAFEHVRSLATIVAQAAQTPRVVDVKWCWRAPRFWKCSTSSALSFARAQLFAHQVNIAAQRIKLVGVRKWHADFFGPAF